MVIFLNLSLCILSPVCSVAFCGVLILHNNFNIGFFSGLLVSAQENITKCHLAEQYWGILLAKTQAPSLEFEPSAELLFGIVRNAPTSFLQHHVQDFMQVASQNRTLSRRVCQYLTASFNILLEVVVDCAQLESLSGESLTLACKCSQNDFPGETNNLTSSSGDDNGQVTQCSANPSVQCTGLWPGLRIGADVLAQLDNQITENSLQTRQATIVVQIATPRLLECRKAAVDDRVQKTGVTVSNITSINILNHANCGVVRVRNVSNLTFLLDYNRSTCISQPTCRYYDNTSRAWLTHGCSSEVTSNIDK